MILDAGLTHLDGDGWIKLRNDDFSDTAEHYTACMPRSEFNGTPQNSPGGKGTVPIISETLMGVIKGMMRSNVEDRIGLKDVFRLAPIHRLSGLVVGHEEDGEMVSNRARRMLGPALVEEEEWFLPYILCEAE